MCYIVGHEGWDVCNVIIERVVGHMTLSGDAWQ
jgi:hypothetical protein